MILLEKDMRFNVPEFTLNSKSIYKYLIFIILFFKITLKS